MCRDEIEYTCHKYASQVRAGQPLNVQIPHVGRLKIKDGLAGVVFDPKLIEVCRGKTAKNYTYTFTGNNWMNNKIYEPNRTNFAQSGPKLERVQYKSPDTAISISNGAN